MAIKKIFPFLLLFIIFLHYSSIAQITIIPDLSDSYVDKLINTAKENYPRIRTLQSRVAIAKTALARNNVSWFDAFTLSYVYQPGTTTIDPTNPSTSYFKGLQAGVFFNIGTIIEKPYQIKQSREELKIANNDQEEYLLTLSTEIKKRYYVYVERLAELKLLTKSLQDMEGSLKDVKYKFEKGEETFDNYNKAQVDYTSRQASKIGAEANLFSAKADLEELLGTKLENVK